MRTTTTTREPAKTKNPGGRRHEQFMQKLAVMHDAEKKETLALPLLAVVARSKELKSVLRTHRQETKGHVASIERTAKSLGAKLGSGTSHTINRLIKESLAATAKHLGKPGMDQALLASALKIERYEIDSYQELCAWADELGYTRELVFLTSNLDQEKVAADVLDRMSRNEGPLAEVVKRVSLHQIASARPARGSQRTPRMRQRPSGSGLAAGKRTSRFSRQ